MDEIIQLKITLQRSNPAIWRRILVEKNVTFYGLHEIIQIAMGWENCHLFEFDVNGIRFNQPEDNFNGDFNDLGLENIEDEDDTDSEEDDEDEMTEFDINDFKKGDELDASYVALGQVLTSSTKKFTYVYDFGDSWTHEITIEKFLPVDAKRDYPVCLAGENQCPPEDCGGIFGYYNLLEILKNKKHPEYRSMREWLDGDFDPTFFEIHEVNNILKLFKVIPENPEDN